MSACAGRYRRWWSSLGALVVLALLPSGCNSVMIRDGTGLCDCLPRPAEACDGVPLYPDCPDADLDAPSDAGASSDPDVR